MKPRRPPLIEAGQRFLRWLFRLLIMLAYRVRVHGLKDYPLQDGFLICANHQSYLDPLVIGVIAPRPFNFLAKSNLFRNKSVAWFLDWNDTIPIDLENSSIGGIKETLRRLKKKESVLMFPEGTRCHDGQLQQLKPGFCALARRAKSPLLPICFAGAFEAMPRTRPIPFPGRIHVVVGKPITYQQYANLNDQEIMLRLEREMKKCLAEAQRRRRR